MVFRQQNSSSNTDIRHARMESRRELHLETTRGSLPFAEAKSWQCSVYYFWWRFLREHQGYRDCCEKGGEGAYADLYRDFGDIRGNDFRSWWKNIGRHLFSEQGISGSVSSGVQGDRKYSVVGKPSLTLLHKRHRLLILVRKFPETPLWKLFDISEDLNRGRTVFSIERNQKTLIARRYYAEAQSIVDFAARGFFPVRSTCQLRRIAGVLSSTTPQSCRVSDPLKVKRADE